MKLLILCVIILDGVNHHGEDFIYYEKLLIDVYNKLKIIFKTILII